MSITTVDTNRMNQFRYTASAFILQGWLRRTDTYHDLGILDHTGHCKMDRNRGWCQWRHFPRWSSESKWQFQLVTKLYRECWITGTWRNTGLVLSNHTCSQVFRVMAGNPLRKRSLQQVPLSQTCTKDRLFKLTSHLLFGEMLAYYARGSKMSAAELLIIFCANKKSWDKMAPN